MRFAIVIAILAGLLAPYIVAAAAPPPPPPDPPRGEFPWQY